MKISIITATFNSAETIRDTLQSVLSQSFTDYELIVKNKGKVVYNKKVNGNSIRLNVLDIPTTNCDEIEIKVFSTYGLNAARIFEVRAY